MSVRVVARIRPLLSKELDKDIIVRAASSEDGRPPNVVKIPSPKNESEEFSFAFNSVYDQSTSQETLFNAEVAPHIKALFQGLDLTIFAYGVTGTGKTHTMRGGMKLADRGVIPRILSHVFRRGKKIAKDSDGNTTVDVALSYYEIYNDKVYDLLEPPEKRTPSGLPLREKDNKTFVVGLSEQACADLKDFERLYIAANQNRVTAATKLNAHSSRSHAILRVKVTQTTRSDDGMSVLSVRESTASAIDLAGSEDNRRTDNGRERLVESAAINKSLFVLSQCVDAIARGEKRIPYRESKMTRILSLGQNNGITVMILNLAPVRSYHLDTLSSLNVSSRAKRIEVREIENEVVFKQPPRSLSSTTTSSSAAGSVTSLSASSSTTSLVRQPLRPLTSNAHNIQNGVVAAKAGADKPVKAFSVYTDRAATKPASTTPTTASIPPSALPSTTSSRMGPLANISQPRSSTSTTKGHGKRTSDPADPRPSKLARPSIHPHSAASIARSRIPSEPSTPVAAAAPVPLLSAEQIEAIIERKVAEALAARAKEEEQKQQQLAQQSAVEPAQEPPAVNSTLQRSNSQADLSEDVQKRLDALERRIGDSTREDDPRAEGLRCLLLARQHKEVGDDAAVLRYYEQALPYFPGQAKLLGKIEKLKAKIARDNGKKAASVGMASPRKQAVSNQKRKRATAAVAAAPASETQEVAPDNHDIGETGEDVDADADYEDSDDDAEDDATFVAEKPSQRRAKTTSNRKVAKTSVFRSPNGNGEDADDESMVPLTPRKRHLLDIVNSRDVARIRGLAGVGAKKARDLVEYLESGGCEGREGEGEGADGHDSQDDNERMSPEDSAPHIQRIETLAQLRNVPGMGGRTVERAYEGLVTAAV